MYTSIKFQVFTDHPACPRAERVHSVSSLAAHADTERTFWSQGSTHKVLMYPLYKAAGVIFGRVEQMACRDVLSKSKGAKKGLRTEFVWSHPGDWSSRPFPDPVLDYVCKLDKASAILF